MLFVGAAREVISRLFSNLRPSPSALAISASRASGVDGLLNWDAHKALKQDYERHGPIFDQPTAALLTDLKQRGLLDDTLLVWGGEFGRTPMVQGGDDGRDHHNRSYCLWLAGGGIKPGFALGKTDELGFTVVEDAVHVHDMHATILHLMGIDHTKLTHRFQGRDFRLTDVHGHVVKDILA